jgi:hypothetical protein
MQNCGKKFVGRGVCYQCKTVFLEKKFFEKTMFFFYSRTSVKNAVYLNIQIFLVKIQNFTEKKHRFCIDNIPPLMV